MAIQAVGYSRLSKEDVKKFENDSESIKNQNSLIEEYVTSKGWVLQEIYSDDDFKGSDRSRPEFNRMLSNAFQGKFDVIVCKNQSRFARDIELIEKYIHGKFIENNIRFIAIQDRIDTANMTNSSKKISQLSGLTDTWYLEDLSHNIIETFDVKRKKGEYIGSWPLYGYLKHPDNKNVLVVDETASEIVKLIFKMYIEGNGLNRIADILNSRNIPNPLKYKQNMGMKIGTKSRITSKTYYWRGDVIGKMLDNTMYLGNMVQGKMKKISYKSKKLVRVPEENWIIVANTHPAIIDNETWETVRKIRRSKVKPKRDGTINIFNGKLRCLECNELMYAITYPKKVNGCASKTEFYSMFRCSKKMMKKDSCDSTGITQVVLEEHIISEINKFSEIYFNADILEEKLQPINERIERKQFLSMEIAKLEKLIEDNNKAITMAYMDKVKKVISDDRFMAINEQLEKEIQSFSRSLQYNENEMNKISEFEEQQENIYDIVQRYRNLEHLNRNIILELIDVIYIGKKNKETKERIIKIVWNF